MKRIAFFLRTENICSCCVLIVYSFTSRSRRPNQYKTFDGAPAESIPNLNPETAHRLDPLAERFAFIPLSGKISFINYESQQPSQLWF